jgi:hypothetical protein
MARTTGSKKIGGKHMQHTTKFINEVNSVNTNSFNPFRYYDEVWIVGKYKGKKLKETPKSYIEWAINNMKLSETALSILKSI